MTFEFLDFVRTNKFNKGIAYKKSVFMFLDSYRITEDELSVDTLLKRFQRWRKKCRKEALLTSSASDIL